MDANTSRLDPAQLVKDTFVVVEQTEYCFEIGLVRQEDYHQGERKILVLTAGGFPTKVPTFREIWNPFLPNTTEEVEVNTHPVYPIDPMLVKELLDQQQEYLKSMPERKSELDAFITMKTMLLEKLSKN